MLIHQLEAQWLEKVDGVKKSMKILASKDVSFIKETYKQREAIKQLSLRTKPAEMRKKSKENECEIN